MLKLNYIIIGKLPEEQMHYLKENMRADGVREGIGWLSSNDCDREQQDIEKVMWESTEQGNKIWIKKLNADLPKERAEECILVSGDAAELREAAHVGMAALAYLPSPDCPDALSYEPTPPADMYAEGFEEIGFTFLQHVYERHHHLPWTILTTERCIVKEFSMEYLDELFALYAGEGMTDYMEPLFPYEQEREYQQAYIENMYEFFGYGMWIVCEKETGKLIGRAGVEHREEFQGELELGYAIGVPYQGKGYATEVCEAILSYTGEELGFPEVYCLIEEGNSVSEHLAEKIGFSYRETLAIDGKKMRKYVRIL